MQSTDTIVAVATAPGRGGVGIVRVSGPLAHQIAHSCTERELTLRYATHCDFLNKENQVIDQGLGWCR